jgi:hypothetical protein
MLALRLLSAALPCARLSNSATLTRPVVEHGQASFFVKPTDRFGNPVALSLDSDALKAFKAEATGPQARSLELLHH